MDDLPTRLSIWLALTLFVAAQVARRGPTAPSVAGLWLFAVGWVAFAGHVLGVESGRLCMIAT